MKKETTERRVIMNGKKEKEIMNEKERRTAKRRK